MAHEDQNCTPLNLQQKNSPIVSQFGVTRSFRTVAAR